MRRSVLRAWASPTPKSLTPAFPLALPPLSLHQVVKHAEQQLLERELAGSENKEYLSIEGLPAFNRVTAELLFGADSPVLAQGRVVTVQGLSVRGDRGWAREGVAGAVRFAPRCTCDLWQKLRHARER